MITSVFVDRPRPRSPIHGATLGVRGSPANGSSGIRSSSVGRRPQRGDNRAANPNQIRKRKRS